MFFEYRRKISENHAGWVVYITDFTSSSLAINATSDNINPFVCVLHIGGDSLFVCLFWKPDFDVTFQRPDSTRVVRRRFFYKKQTKISFLFSVELCSRAKYGTLSRHNFFYLIYFLFIFFLFRLFFFLILRCRKLGEMGEIERESLLFVRLVFVAWQRFFFFSFLSREWRIYC